MRKCDGPHGVRFANLYATDGGVMLNFANRIEPWVGMFPGCSFDDYYDSVLPRLTGTAPNTSLPILVVARHLEGHCEACRVDTSHKYCSMKCWYTNIMSSTDIRLSGMIYRDERDALNKFKYQLELIFGTMLLKEEQSAAKEDDLLGPDPFGPYRQRFSGS